MYKIIWVIYNLLTVHLRSKKEKLHIGAGKEKWSVYKGTAYNTVWKEHVLFMRSNEKQTWYNVSELTFIFLTPSRSHSSMMAIAFALSFGGNFCTVGKMSSVGFSPIFFIISAQFKTGTVSVPSMSNMTPLTSVMSPRLTLTGAHDEESSIWDFEMLLRTFSG